MCRRIRQQLNRKTGDNQLPFQTIHTAQIRFGRHHTLQSRHKMPIHF
jgi:hypothetical protein